MSACLRGFGFFKFYRCLLVIQQTCLPTLLLEIIPRVQTLAIDIIFAVALIYEPAPMLEIYNKFIQSNPQSLRIARAS